MESATKRVRERKDNYTQDRKYELTANEDDYGMRKVSNGLRNVTTRPSQQRKNNFCSSEAQAII